MSKICYRSFEEPATYLEAKSIQLEIVEDRIADRIGDHVLFFEHHPVVTQGRGLQRTQTQPKVGAHERIPTLPPEIEFHSSERGGDLTYHGPGQLVIYPIFKLRTKDLHTYLRMLEQVTIDVLKTYGLLGQARESATGVWVGDRKIASIGIAVRRWVTYHGIGLNVVNDMSPFSLFNPCGYQPEVMTNLVTLLRERENVINSNVVGKDSLGSSAQNRKFDIKADWRWREELEARFKIAFDQRQSHLFETLDHS